MARFLITAGPTREHIDDVRFLSNGSTGRMGYGIAEAAIAAGHEVVLVSGPTALDCPEGVTRIDVVSALEMQAAAAEHLGSADFVFGVAAVADHRPAARAAGKPPRGGPVTLELLPNPDIIAGLAANRRPDQVMVGFALEVDPAGPEAARLDPVAGLHRAAVRGRQKLAKKGLDAICVNLADALAAARNQVLLLWSDGREEMIAQSDKAVVAARLVAAVSAAPR